MTPIKPTTRRLLLYAMLLAATIGTGALFTAACNELQVTDPDTGILRPATLDEATDYITQAGTLAKTALAASGHPEWWPFADIGVRIAVLLYAIRFGQPLTTKAQASPTQGAT